MAEPNQQPTAEDAAKATKVGTAGVEAAAAGNDPAPAMKAEADRINFDIPDEVIDKMAKAISDQNIAALEQRGAFDTPPEPVKPPEQPATAAPEQADQGTEGQAEQPPERTEEPAPAPPGKRTWAHKFLGV